MMVLLTPQSTEQFDEAEVFRMLPQPPLLGLLWIPARCQWDQEPAGRAYYVSERGKQEPMAQRLCQTFSTPLSGLAPSADCLAQMIKKNAARMLMTR